MIVAFGGDDVILAGAGNDLICGGLGDEPAPSDPLDDLAEQVAASGITSVEGDVVVDDRLWETWNTADGPISPMVVNDNLLDVVATPTEPGQPAALRMIPETSAYTA